jgi:uncharacterized repeat protein (TIGR02543 family)
MKKIGKKFVLALLCVTLTLALLPLTALAATSSVHITNDGSKTTVQNEVAGQSFTPTKEGTIDAFDVKLRKYDFSGSFKVKIELWSADANGLPKMRLASTGEKTVSSGESLSNWNKFTFATPYAVTAGTKYVMIVVADDRFNEWMEIKCADADTYSGGYMMEKCMMGWSNKSGNDLAFRCWLTPAEYTVKFLPGAHGAFDPSGAADTQTVEYGNNATAPTVIPDDYYEFTGWSGGFTNVTANLEVTAQYALVKHTVTFLTGSHGTFDPDGAASVQQIEHGSAATAPTVIADENYEFTGWSATFSTVTADLEVTAQYALVKHAVTFLEGDHGAFDPAGAAAAQQVAHGAAALAPTVLPDEGYEHIGWDMAFSNVTAPLTVTAMYEKCEYTVSFQSNGGSAVPDIMAEFDSLIAAPAEPTRDYHTFGGWYKDEGLTKKWDFAADKVGSSDMTLYAAWTPYPITNLTAAYTMYTGARVTWSPQPPNGGWTWDDDYLSASLDGGKVTFTALAEGVTNAVYKANGVTLTVKVTILKPEVPVTGQDDTLFKVLASMAGAALAGGLLMLIRHKHAAAKTR